MAIRQFETHISLNKGILIQFPLTRQDVSSIGWTTWINFDPSWQTRNPGERYWRRIGVVVRETTRLERKKLRRILKQNPITIDKMYVYTSGTSRETYTSWNPHRQQKWGTKMSSKYADSTAELKFDPFDLYAMLSVVHESGVGQPLGDWLVETETDFAPYIREAGWLPETMAEMEKVKSARDKEYKRKIAAIEAVACEVENEENRWR